LAGHGVALALGPRSLVSVADLSEGQDRQRDRDRDEASPHTDILVRRQVGVKESRCPVVGSFPGAGSVWLWVAIDADTKIVPSVHLGQRTAEDAYEFVNDLASRLTHRVQLTSDGHRPYLDAVESAFGAGIDYAMLVKLYGNDSNAASPERRYSPGECIGAIPTVISGDPNPKHISTSFIERQNWTLRGTMRRYTRLSNGFSRKIENHMAAVAINYFAYNFIKIHSTLRTSPAMAAGVTDRLFDVSDLVALLVESEKKTA
jgi:IS1 family transposase